MNKISVEILGADSLFLCLYVSSYLLLLLHRFGLCHVTRDVDFVNLEGCLIYISCRTLPEISREEFELIFDELDDSHDFKVCPFT